MPRYQLKIERTGAEAVSMEMLADGEPCTTFRLNAPDLDSLITTLAGARSIMTPPVPQTPPDGVVWTIADPNWKLSPYPSPGMRVLLFRHQGLGWLGLLLADAEAKKLGHALLETPQPEPSSQNAPTGRLQ
jgi:hypothetical protein